MWASQMVLVVKNPSALAGVIRNTDSDPGSGRSPGGGRGDPLQYSHLETPTDTGAWQVRVRHDWSNSAHMHLGCSQHWDVISIMCWSSNKNPWENFKFFANRQLPMTSFNQVKQVWGHCSPTLSLIHCRSHENMATQENKELRVCS